MNKRVVLIVILIFMISAAGYHGFASSEDVIDKIKINNKDIPNGFMYGKIPKFAQKVLKKNPWVMDSNAIRTLANKIYPGGDHNCISKIHVSILAKKETPFGDDIVCYIISYRDSVSAKREIKKIKEFAGYNGDRVIVQTKNNLAVFLHVDNVEDFHLIEKMNEKIKDRLGGV